MEGQRLEVIVAPCHISCWQASASPAAQNMSRRDSDPDLILFDGTQLSYGVFLVTVLAVMYT